MKKKYSKPEMKVYMVETQNILAASVGVEVQGLSDEFYYDSEAGDGSDAW